MEPRVGRGNLTFRPATLADVSLLRRWDELPHIVASDPRAHRFYEWLDFRFLEARRFGPDDCYVYRLKRKDWHSE